MGERMNARDMTVNADALTGLELEFHVCKALGTMDKDAPECTLANFLEVGGLGGFGADDMVAAIEKHKITLFYDSGWRAGVNAEVYDRGILSLDFEAEGDTAHQAVMRCLVKRGPEPRPAWETTPQEPQ